MVTVWGVQSTMVPSGIMDDNGFRVPRGSRLSLFKSYELRLIWSITVVLSCSWKVNLDGIIVLLMMDPKAASS